MADAPVIRVEGVSKDFHLPHYAEDSIKRRVINTFRKKDKSVDIQHALRDVTFEVQKGEFFGILGRNGSGKSTLLKIISDIYVPTKGKVSHDGRLVSFIELGVGFSPDLTGRDNVYLNGALLGFSRKEIDRQYEEIVAFAELEEFMEQKLKNYSSGMKVRLAFSVAIRADADILVLDEVLAVGDADFQRKCFDYFDEIKKKGTTIVFVSHSMDAVRRYCDRALLIEDSKVVDIGDAENIATLYSKLFIRNKKHESVSRGKSPSGQERWGDEKLVWEKVTAQPIDDTVGDARTIKITAEGKALEEVEQPIFGFAIKDSEFKPLVGTNTTRNRIKIKPLQKNEKFEITWLMPNIFNEGRYYVDCTAAYNQADRVSDRWPEAIDFYVERLQDNPYPFCIEGIEFESSIGMEKHEKSS